MEEITEDPVYFVQLNFLLSHHLSTGVSRLFLVQICIFLYNEIPTALSQTLSPHGGTWRTMQCRICTVTEPACECVCM